MQKNLDGTVDATKPVETTESKTSTNASDNSTAISPLETMNKSLDDSLSQVLEKLDALVLIKGLSAQQVGGEIGSKMLKLQNELKLILDKGVQDVTKQTTEVAKPAEAPKETTTVSKADEEFQRIVKEVVNQVTEINKLTFAELAKQLVVKQEISNIEKTVNDFNTVINTSIDTVKTSLKTESDILKADISKLQERLLAVEKAGGLSKSIPVQSGQSNQKSGPADGNPWAGHFDKFRALVSK